MWFLQQASTILAAILGILVTLGGLATQAKKIRNFLFGDLIADVHETRLAVLRVEILTNIYNTPERAAVIEELFEEYKKLGGNYYINSIVQAWRDEYEKPVIKKRIGTRKKKDKNAGSNKQK